MQKEKSKNKRGGFFSKSLGIILLVLVILIGAGVILNEFYIDIIWFEEVGFTDVFFKSLMTHLKLGGPLFLILFVVFSVYFKLLTLSGGKTIVKTSGGSSFIKGKLPYVLSFGIALFTSIIMTSTLWYDFLEFSSSVPFNQLDPVFGLDISFYVFKLPFLKGLLSLLSFVMFILAGATFIYSVMVIAEKSSEDRHSANEFENIDKSDVRGFFSRMWSSFRKQIVFFLSGLALIAAAHFYLKRYELLYSANGIVYGAGFTDLHVTLNIYNALWVILLVSAVVIAISGIAKKVKPIFVCVVLTVGIYFIGVGASVAVQSLIVSPNEFSKESLYIDYNIEATQHAYGLDKIETKTYTVNNNITAEDIVQNVITIENIPINDYKPTLDTYNSLQSMRTYYEFNDVDVDRYYLNGDYTQVFISAREMNVNKLNTDAQTWINKYMKYTHGFGVAVSPVNSVNETGQPVLIAKDIPTITDYSDLDLVQPRIYFGETTDDYAIVNTRAKEFDYPFGSDNIENIYDGTAGIELTMLNRISFALSEGTMKFLLSGDITPDSKILINRNVMNRVMKIAPFLSYDSDPYLVISEGKLYWIVDAMTTTDRYPYAQPHEYGFNYIRNSVKVVVDAYNGDVSYYIVDADDPIAAVYSKIYPSLFKSFDEMPNDIKQHLRYSESYLKVQADMYSTYHMTNTSVFYNKEDAWAIANQYYGSEKTSEKVNPAYMIMKLPEREEEFLLMVPYTAVNKNNMVAWMAGICDGDEYGKLIVYEFNKQSLVYGPMQIEQRIDQDTTIAPQLNLLAQNGSSVLRGNLLTVPIEESILYIEPVYVQAAQTSMSLPEMKKVILSYKDNIIMADTLQEGIEIMFGKIASIEDASPSMPDGSDNNIPYETTSVKELALQAQAVYDKAQSAVSSGDWASYGNYMEQLEQILAKLAEISE